MKKQLELKTSWEIFVLLVLLILGISAWLKYQDWFNSYGWHLIATFSIIGAIIGAIAMAFFGLFRSISNNSFGGLVTDTLINIILGLTIGACLSLLIGGVNLRSPVIGSIGGGGLIAIIIIKDLIERTIALKNE